MSGIDINRIGEAADHLITAPMSNWTILKGIPLLKLYATARRKAGGDPLTLTAAALLKKHVAAGDTVLMLSGFIMRGYGLPETDGPIGAAVLARALAVGLGAIPVGVSEDSVVPCMRACFAAAGLIPAAMDEIRSGRNRCAFTGFPVDRQEAEKEQVNLARQMVAEQSASLRGQNEAARAEADVLKKRLERQTIF